MSLRCGLVECIHSVQLFLYVGDFLYCKTCHMCCCSELSCMINMNNIPETSAEGIIYHEYHILLQAPLRLQHVRVKHHRLLTVDWETPYLSLQSLILHLAELGFPRSRKIWKCQGFVMYFLKMSWEFLQHFFSGHDQL